MILHVMAYIFKEKSGSFFKNNCHSNTSKDQQLTKHAEDFEEDQSASAAE